MKSAIVTGFAEGIGFSLAKKLVEDGFQVIGIDVDAEKAKDAQVKLERLGGNVSVLIANLCVDSDNEMLISRLKTFGLIDILIQNAGISAVGMFKDLNRINLDRVIQLNLVAPLILTAGLLKGCRFQKNATIVFISSLSHYLSYPGASVYTATKSGVASYSRSLFASKNRCAIHTLTVFPGPTRTAHADRYSPDNSKAHKRMAPDVLAAKIMKAIVCKRHVLIPGFGNKIFAFLGHFFPFITEALMKKAVYDKLKGPT